MWYFRYNIDKSFQMSKGGENHDRERDGAKKY